MRTGYKILFSVLAITIISTVSSGQTKNLINDGSMVHDVGSMHLNITNFGAIGSFTGAVTPMAGAPSARWPGASGVDHIYSAGLMVGARVSGVAQVSTGQYTSEIRASNDFLDVIYEADQLALGGSRYPDLDPDDDGDGLEDEDPLNGLDDDGDGLIDEDYAQISDQYFRCVMRDDADGVTDIYPDHTPMGLEVIQESFQWADDAVSGGVGFRYIIKNDGVELLEDVHLGFFMDGDIDNAEDDLAFGWSGLVNLDGEFVSVQLVGMKDAAGIGGLVAVLVLDHPTDPTGIVAPENLFPNAVRIMSGMMAYDGGGDPVNDAERYHMLSTTRWDPDTLPYQASDYRVSISTGRFASLAPGESITLDLAMIVAADMGDLLQLAAEMVVTQRGFAYDRDGDPSNGDEYIVNWHRAGDTPVANEPQDEDELQPQFAAVLTAAPNPFNPMTRLTFTLDRPASVSLRVHDLAGRVVAQLVAGNRSAGSHHVVWNGNSSDGRSLSSGRYLAVLETDSRRLVRSISLIR